LAYTSENATFERLTEVYRGQIRVHQQQRPRLGSEIEAVVGQTANERKRLGYVTEWLAELEGFKRRGLTRNQVINEELREKARTEAEVSRLEAQLARLQQNMGDIDVRIEDVRASYRRQIATEMQDTLQRLRETEVTLGTARELRDVLAQEGGSEDSIDVRHTIVITRTRQRGVTSFRATSDTLLEPGDVIEVMKRRRHEGDRSTPLPAEPALPSEPARFIERTASQGLNR
jgi:polysaccharide biosynthesis/export protein